MNEKSTLPKGWRWAKLGEIGAMTDGDWILNADYAPSGVRLLQVGDVGLGKFIGKSSRFITMDRAKELNCTFLKVGDILISRMPDPIGRACQLPDLRYPCITAVDVSIWRPNPNRANRQYLTYYLNYSDWFVRVKTLVSGATRSRISRSNLETLEIPLPPLPEQKRIAEKIREMMQEVERARTACEKQLEAAKALLSAYLRQVFESEEAKKWERKRLGEVCETFSGSSAPQEKKYFENGKYPFVRVQDLGRYGRTVNLAQTRDYINELAIKELNLKKAEKGTILFPKSGAAIATNNRAILGVDAFIVSHLAALKPIEGISNTLFIYFWLCLIDMIQYMENPGYPSLKLSTISKIFIPLPSLDTQQHIATELKEKMAEAEKLRTSIKKQLDTINVLPQAILRKAFGGKL